MTHLPLTRSLVLASALAVGLPGLAHAQEMDVVEVANGDRIRGDVRSLRHGILAFRTPAADRPGAQRWAGTLSIVWTEVVALTSMQQLDVELSSGERFTGSITSPSPGRVIVQTASGPSPPIEMREVVGIILVEAGFRARTTGSVDFGLTLTNAQDARTYTLNGEAQYRSPGHAYETQLRLNSWLSAREGVETLTRNDVAVEVRRRLARRWFGFVHSEVQQDEPLELDVRVLADGGIGRTLVQSNRTRVSVRGGLAYNAENYAGVETDHSAEAVAGADWDWFEAGGAMAATVAADTFISLARARVRLELDASVRRDVFWSLYWALNVVESFDGDPPDDRPRSDLAVSFTLGWAF